MKKIKIFTKTFQYFFLIELLFIPIFLFVIITNYNSDITMLKANEMEKLTLSARVASSVLKNIDTDLIFLSNCGILKDLTEDKNESTLKSAQLSFLNFSEAKVIYDQIRYIDSSGMEIVRVNNNNRDPYIVNNEELQNKKNRYYFTDTYNIDSGKIFISPLDLNIENGKIEKPHKPMLRLGTPVYDNKGNKRGIILVNYLARYMLNDIRKLYISKYNELLRGLPIADAIKFSSPVRSMPLLLNKNGDFLIGEKSEDEWNFMLKHGVSIKEKCSEAWEIMETNHSGQIKTCEGLFTYTTIYPAKRGFVSSSGSSLPAAKSDENLNHSDYYWKISSYVKKVELDKMLHDTIKVALITIPAISIMLLIIGYILAKTMYQKREAQSNVKILNGLLPICSSCKKIRNDNGYWDQLEGYICDHSEADFSHSICPDCIKKIYPDLDINLEKK